MAEPPASLPPPPPPPPAPPPEAGGSFTLRLRPLSFGELLDEVFRVYRRHFWLFVSIALVLALPTLVLQIVSGQADQIGCHVITVTHDLLKKLPLLGKDLDEFSLDTVQMFHRDAVSAGFQL